SKSGRNRRIASTASTPDPHCATTSISGSRPESTRRLLRASGSSSTMTVRILAVLNRLLQRHTNRYFDSARFLILYVHFELLAVKALQARANVRQPDAARLLFPSL